MSLLNPYRHTYVFRRRDSFTFHNVSIKSNIIGNYVAEMLLFTFHNVSIKSRSVIE